MSSNLIPVSDSVQKSLSDFAFDGCSYNDVIQNLIDYFVENEEFSDEQAEFYNSEIEKVESGFYDDVPTMSLSEIEDEIVKLEKEI